MQVTSQATVGDDAMNEIHVNVDTPGAITMHPDLRALLSLAVHKDEPSRVFTKRLADTIERLNEYGPNLTLFNRPRMLEGLTRVLKAKVEYLNKDLDVAMTELNMDPDEFLTPLEDEEMQTALARPTLPASDRSSILSASSAGSSSLGHPNAGRRSPVTDEPLLRRERRPNMRRTVPRNLQWRIDDMYEPFQGSLSDEGPSPLAYEPRENPAARSQAAPLSHPGVRRAVRPASQDDPDRQTYGETAHRGPRGHDEYAPLNAASQAQENADISERMMANTPDAGNVDVEDLIGSDADIDLGINDEADDANMWGGESRPEFRRRVGVSGQGTGMEGDQDPAIVGARRSRPLSFPRFDRETIVDNLTSDPRNAGNAVAILERILAAQTIMLARARRRRKRTMMLRKMRKLHTLFDIRLPPPQFSAKMRRRGGKPQPLSSGGTLAQPNNGQSPRPVSQTTGAPLSPAEGATARGGQVDNQQGGYDEDAMGQSLNNDQGFSQPPSMMVDMDATAAARRPHLSAREDNITGYSVHFPVFPDSRETSTTGLARRHGDTAFARRERPMTAIESLQANASLIQTPRSIMISGEQSESNQSSRDQFLHPANAATRAGIRGRRDHQESGTLDVEEADPLELLSEDEMHYTPGHTPEPTSPPSYMDAVPEDVPRLLPGRPVPNHFKPRRLPLTDSQMQSLNKKRLHREEAVNHAVYQSIERNAVNRSVMFETLIDDPLRNFSFGPGFYSLIGLTEKDCIELNQEFGGDIEITLTDHAPTFPPDVSSRPRKKRTVLPSQSRGSQSFAIGTHEPTQSSSPSQRDQAFIGSGSLDSVMSVPEDASGSGLILPAAESSPLQSQIRSESDSIHEIGVDAGRRTPANAEETPSSAPSSPQVFLPSSDK